jgi:hypothetical protein
LYARIQLKNPENTDVESTLSVNRNSTMKLQPKNDEKFIRALIPNIEAGEVASVGESVK